LRTAAAARRSVLALPALPALPALLALLALGAGPARADQPLWELGLGAGWLHLPHYRGSDQAHDWLLPVPYAVYRGKIFRANRDGARAVLLDSERFDFDLSVGASAPVRSRDDTARSGMPDLAPTLEIGPNLNAVLARGSGWKLDLRLPVHAVVTVESRPQGIGWTASPALNLDLQLGGWNAGLQGGPLYASRRYHAYYYGVDPVYATATRPAYGAGAGAAGWRATAAVSRRYGTLWLGAFLRADSLAGAVFDASPLVRTRTNLTGGLALSWVFKNSDERVSDER
jgi:outer membrane scaffolding protein for murein synthesis (MipA/OmpV family)